MGSPVTVLAPKDDLMLSTDALIISLILFSLIFSYPFVLAEQQFSDFPVPHS